MSDNFKSGEIVYYFDSNQDQIRKGYFLRYVSNEETKYLRDNVSYQLADLAGNPVFVADIYTEDQLDMPDEAFEYLLSKFLKKKQIDELTLIKMNKFSDAQIGKLLKETLKDGDLKHELLDKVISLISNHQLYYKYK